MNRKIPMQHGPSPLERVGMQTVLLGMEATLDQHVSAINDIRDQLGHPQIAILRGVVEANDHAPAKHQITTNHHNVTEMNVRQITAPPSPVKQSHRNGSKPKIAKQWKRRKAILNAAGMGANLQGMPSNKTVEKAVRKLERLGKPVPTGDEPAAKKPTAPLKRTMSAKAKKLLGKSSKARWALIREAGLKSSTLPTNGMLAKARRILALREQAAKLPAKKQAPAALQKQKKRVAGSLKRDKAVLQPTIPVETPQQEEASPEASQPEEVQPV